MAREITAAALAQLLDAGSPLALIDVREHGEYNLAHIAGATSVPRRQLEARAGRLDTDTVTDMITATAIPERRSRSPDPGRRIATPVA